MKLFSTNLLVIGVMFGVVLTVQEGRTVAATDDEQSPKHHFNANSSKRQFLVQPSGHAPSPGESQPRVISIQIGQRCADSDGIGGSNDVYRFYVLLFLYFICRFPNLLFHSDFIAA